MNSAVSELFQLVIQDVEGYVGKIVHYLPSIYWRGNLWNKQISALHWMLERELLPEPVS